MGRFAIPGLALILVVGQVLAWFAISFRGAVEPADLALIPAAVIAGQWWRLITFVFIPPALGLSLNPILVDVFGWWMFFFLGSALEGYWGAFRFNVFLFVGYALTVAVSFLFPGGLVTYLSLAGSVFLAFAYLNPNFEILLFYIIPVRIKWLALVAWATYLISFVRSDWPGRLQVLAAVGNFFLFFGRDLWRAAGVRTRQVTTGAARAAERSAPGARHTCRICGKTDRTNPEMDFRYCSRCAGDACYCPEHISNHVHVTDPEAKESPTP